MYVIRFVDENGYNYDTTETITGPYGDTGVFTGPKVCYIIMVLNALRMLFLYNICIQEDAVTYYCIAIVL